MKIIETLKNLIWKKEKKYYPPHFLRIAYTPTAKHKGTFDEFNREIHRIKDGEPVQIIPYTKADLEELKKRYNIPAIFEKIEEDEEYEFEPFDDLDMIVYKG